MQGLLNRGKAPQQAGPQQQPQQQPQQPRQPQQPQQPRQAQEQPPQGEPETVASQETYDVATGQMLQFIYDKEKGLAALERYTQASGNVGEAMGRLLGRLLVMTVQSAVMSGKRIAPDLVFQGGIEAARALSEVAQKNGMLDKSQEKAVTEDAFFEGIALFATEAKEEALTDPERQRYIELLDKVEQMQAQGAGMEDRKPQEQEMQA